MKIIDRYSHLYDEEYLIAREPQILAEIERVIRTVNAKDCFTYKSRAKKTQGQTFYSPKALNACFMAEFKKRKWQSSTYTYYLTLDRELMEATLSMSAEEQKEFLKAKTGKAPLQSSNQTDFVRNDIAVEVQFGHYTAVAYDLFVKHMMFFTGGKIKVGVEILPMKSLLDQMSSGPPYFEKEVYNVMRQGRSSPPVPLLILGIAP